ncbi:MAG TPA: radical SAM protein [Candidatus Bathyarchaeia archaeon]|nr:radical SAM protein [Candidatus Bathyarchaeia archaeon]
MPHRESFLKPLIIKQLDLVILFVTSICNARCRTCFYWLELNKKGDMTFDEISKLSITMPKFHDLWISGGEPFLRKDLAEIIHLFYRNNNIRDVRIPTNGLPTLQTISTTRKILELCPQIQLEIDISIDGFRETHDRIRGVPGNYDKLLTTMSELGKVRTLNPNLTLFINTVITRENEDQVVGLGQYFEESRMEMDGHYFQIIRGNPLDPRLENIESDKLKEVYNELIPINNEYISRPKGKHTILEWVRRAYWKAGYIFSYETQYQNYASKTQWKMPCTAGQTSIVIDYNSDVRVCELRKPIGNLRKFGMNFQTFWNSLDRKREVEQVKFDKCFCTHICFMYDSMRHSKRAMLYEIPLITIKSALTRRVKEILPSST